jgi:hypothetical protein
MRLALAALAAIAAAAVTIPDTASAAHRSGGCGLMITPEVRTQWMSVDTPTSSDSGYEPSSGSSQTIRLI